MPYLCLLRNLSCHRCLCLRCLCLLALCPVPDILNVNFHLNLFIRCVRFSFEDDEDEMEVIVKKTFGDLASVKIIVYGEMSTYNLKTMIKNTWNMKIAHQSLMAKTDGVPLENHRSLDELGIKHGDSLRLVLNLVF